MWVLAILYAAYQVGAAVTTHEFISKESCEQAGIEIKKVMSVKTVCVKR